jgi:hypothetical protein
VIYRLIKLRTRFICKLYLLVLLSCSFGLLARGQTGNHKKASQQKISADSPTPQTAPSVLAPTPALAVTPSPAKDKTPANPTVPGESLPKSLQVLKAVTEILAYIFAFFFFLFRTLVGYLTNNVVLGIDTKRCQVRTDNPNKDILVVNVTITKKENGLLRLLLAHVRISGLTSGDNVLKALDARRLDYDCDKVLSGTTDAINWSKPHEQYPYLQFPPGEGTCFATHFEVNAGEPYQVEIVLMGRGKRPKIAISQWRASCISLPTSCTTSAPPTKQP